jgi:Ecdysteroid kinase-like family
MTAREEQETSFLDSDAIGDDFFIGIVKSKLKLSHSEFKLRLVLLSPATGKNENFVSVLYRAKIKIEILATNERKSVDIIIKALLSTLPEMKDFGVFPRERFMYENVLSSYEQICLETTGERIKFGPASFKFAIDPYEIMVLEDLKEAGYQMLDRKIGLNLTQSKMLLSQLAKFHAASAVRFQKVKLD